MTPSSQARPIGKDAVRGALIQATTELIVKKGLSISVREIASYAGVNHGLVHTYFGNKAGLLAAAFDEIHERAAADRDEQGFPPPDLAGHRGGELAKALARIMLEHPTDPFSSHPIASSWIAALGRTSPELTPHEVEERVILASSLALGWALFADHLSSVVNLDAQRRSQVEASVASLVAELGGIPTDASRAEASEADGPAA